MEGGIVENRIKQLQRVLLAEYVQCPEWAPEASTSLTAAGIGSRGTGRLALLDLTVFSRREQAALRYTEGLVGTGQVSDAVFDDLKAEFTESEIVELGYAVSVQNGASRIFRSLLGTKWLQPRSSTRTTRKGEERKGLTLSLPTGDWCGPTANTK